MLSDDEILQITGGSKDWTLRPTGGGFQGSHFYLECEGRRWFVKAQPEHPFSDYYEKLGAFVKEPKVYSTLLPEVSRFLKGRSFGTGAAAIADNTTYQIKLPDVTTVFSAELQGSLLALNNINTSHKDRITPGVKIWPDVQLARKGAMVLEDLTVSGWELSQGLDCEHIKVALGALATFHAASINLDLQTPLLRYYPNIIRETYLVDSPSHPGLQTWLSFVNTARKIYSIYFPGRNPENALSLMKKATEMVKPSLRHRNCLCHGDLWQNNIFFKYINGIPVEACFVDFAQVRYCPPALDLLMFLKHLQVEDLDPFVLHYHTRLREQVPDFSLKQLLDSFEIALPFALCMAPLYVFLTRLPEKALKEITRTQETFWEFATGGDRPALEAAEEDDQYRQALLRAFKELLDFTDNYIYPAIDNI